jgi:DNA polymerase-3 subunit delta
MRASPLDIEGRIEALLSSIKAGDIKPVYLLYGEEGYLIEETKERMVKLLLPDETLRDFNLDLLGGDFEERDLIGLVETYPVMAERRVVLLKDPGFMMEKEAGPFVSYFERRGFPEWTSIVMSFIESEERKVERDSPAFLLVRKYGEALEFPPFSRTSERDMEVLFRIVSSRLEGKRVSKEAFIKAVELVGTDLRLLISELSKAGDFSMGSGSITAEDLESVSSLRIAEERTFDLLDAISNGDVGGAIFRAQRLLEDGEEPIFILYDPEISRLATFPYRDFASRLSSYLKEKALGEVGIGLLDQHPYVIYKVLGQAKRMRKRTILEILRDLEDTDSSMKSGRGSQEISLLLFLARSTARIHSSSIPF